MTNYYERCLKRINEATGIEYGRYPYGETDGYYITKCELKVSQLNGRNTISFKGVSVPVSKEEAKLLFDASCKKDEELTAMEHNKILEQL